jgi:fused signal recognition particle receptor
MDNELISLGVALVAIAGVIFGLRRAASKSRDRAVQSVQERLGVGEAPAERQRKRRPAASAAPEMPSTAPTADEGDEADDAASAAPGGGETEAPSSEATDAYRAGLARTRGGFVARLGKLFGKKRIDAALLDELEEVLLTADIGPRAADRIFQGVKSGLSKDELEAPAKVWAQIRSTSREILRLDAAPVDPGAHRPWVLLTIGVNGVGKTTTIGKLAAKFRRDGKKVLLAAGDTFRAAATEQLEEWGKRAEVPVVKGKSGQDPSSVIFEAVKRGVDEGFDVVICDTAGRLHSNTGLMDELKKIRRVCDKALPGSPHDTWMVLDATTGQNAIAQAKTFKAELEITGIVLTKLDGSAKGGVVLGICDELKVPVRYVGVGEKIDDLRPFDPDAFVTALYEDSNDAPDASV